MTGPGSSTPTAADRDISEGPEGELDRLRARLVALEREAGEHELGDARRRAEHAVNRILAQSPDLADVMPPLLAALAETLGWQFAAYWRLDADDAVLRCETTWLAAGDGLLAFEAATRGLAVAPGVGLPGRSWADGSPTWVSDLSQEMNFPRHAAALAAGLHGGFAFPLHGSAGVVGVIECLSYAVQPSDRPLLDTLAIVGNQVGQFIERARVLEAIRESEARKAAILDTALDAIITMDADGRVVDFNPAAERSFGYTREQAVGHELAELIIPPALREQHRQGLARYLETGVGPVLGERLELTAVRADGSEFPVELAITATLTGSRVLFTGNLRDISERAHSDEALRARARQQAAVASLGQQALRTGDIDQLLQQATQVVAETLGVECAAVTQLLPGTQTLVTRGATGWDDESVRRIAELGAPEQSHAGYSLVQREAVIFEELATERRFRAPLLEAAGVVSGMDAIIDGGDGEPWGILAAHSRARRSFTPDDLNFLQGVANLLAAAIEQRETEAREQFLAEAGRAFVTSLDYEETVATVAHTVVPRLADWCAIHLLDEQGELRCVEVGYADPAQADLAQQLLEASAREPEPPEVVEAVRSGEPMLFNPVDESMLRVRRDSPRMQLIRRLGLRSIVLVPLVAGGHVLGSISLVRTARAAFTPADVTFAREVADLAALAIDSARLFQREQAARDLLAQRVRQQAAVAALGRTALGGAELPALMDEAARLAAETLGANYASVLVPEPDARTLRLRAGLGWRAGIVGQLTIPIDSASLPGRALLTSEQVVVEDLASDPRFHTAPVLTEHGVVSGVALVIEGHHQPWGVLTVFCTRRRHFTQEDVHFLESVSHVLGAAIEQRRLADAQRLLADASGILARSFDDESTLAQVTQLAVPAFGDWCAVYLLDEDGMLRCLEVAHADLALAEIAEFLRNEHRIDPAGTTRMAEVMRSGEALILSADEDQFQGRSGEDPRLDRLRAAGFVSSMLAPLVARGQHLGVIAIRTATAGRRYDQSDLALASELAHRAALSVDNARLFRQAQQAEEAQRFLADASRVLASSLEFDATLENLAALAVPRVADWCLVFVRDEQGRIHTPLIQHEDPAQVEAVRAIAERYGVPGDSRGVGTVISTGHARYYRELDDETMAKLAHDPGGNAFIREAGVRSGMMLPLQARGETFGAIGLFCAQSERCFETADFVLAQEFAHRAGIALDNARLYQQAAEAARLREEFVSMASHELRSPLTSILGFTRRLARRAQTGASPSDEQSRDELATVLTEAERMRSTLELFLDLARIESHRLVVELEPVDLRRLTRDEVAALRERHPRATVVEQYAEQPVVVESDGDRIRQVLTNLLDNAVKYGGEQPTVTVTIAAEDGRGVIRVRDNGPGIAPEDQPHIFERLYRGQAEATRRARGLGLGLYISRYIVDRLGGGLTFTTAPGAGTEFELRLGQVLALDGEDE